MTAGSDARFLDAVSGDSSWRMREDVVNRVGDVVYGVAQKNDVQRRARG